MENAVSTEQSQMLLKHSGVGIASFIISLVMGVFFVVLILGAGIIEVATPGGLSENSPVIIIIGLCAILGLIACLIGIGLGIAGVLQKNRKIIFSILGLIFNATILLGVVVLIIVGNLM